MLFYIRDDTFRHYRADRQRHSDGVDCRPDPYDGQLFGQGLYLDRNGHDTNGDRIERR